MNNNFTESARALDQLAVQYKALISLAEQLRSIGSIEQKSAASQSPLKGTYEHADDGRRSRS